MLNEHENMDELFRKAAEDYPLRLEPKEWNNKATSYANVPVASRLAAIKRYFIAVVLLFVAIITGFLILNNKTETVSTALQSNPQKNVQTSNSNENEVTKETTLDDTPNDLDKFDISDVSSRSNRRQKSIAVSNTKSSVPVNETVSTPSNFAIFDNTIPITALRIATEKGIVNPDPQAKQKSTVFTNEAKNELARNSELTTVNVEETTTDVKLLVEEKTNNKESEGNKAIAKTENKKTKHNEKRQFYYGLSSTINLSTIKQQAIVSPMVGLGVVAGISFNKSFSLETGLQLSSHKYYTTGEYFKPKAGVMPANMKVEDMIGKVNTIDLPISLKYNFSSLQKNLFVTTGLSNTIITDEHNVYDVTVNGQAMSMIGDYNKTKFIPVSSINFSVGYQKQLGKNFIAQAEPYIQIPLRGTGVGYMPVTNFGLRLAFLKFK